MVYFNTSGISSELRPYFPLLLDLITESPIRQADGTLIPYEQVVAAIESDTVSLQTSLGLESTKQFSCGSYSQTAVLLLKTEHKKYNRGIQWVSDLLNNTEFTIDRIRVTGAKIANAVSQAKRNGNAVTHDLLKAIYYDKTSNVRCCSMIHQQRFLNGLLERIKDEAEATKVIDDLNRIRTDLLITSRMSLYVAADWEKVLNENAEFYSQWKNIIPNVAQEKFEYVTFRYFFFISITNAIFYLNSKTKHERPQVDYLLRKSDISDGQTLGLGCVEGAFLAHAIPCEISLNDPAYIPLMLFMQYLTQLEGPFWRQIRGQGILK